MGIVVYADSSAALGVVKRKGAGRLRHVNVAMLWIQDLREGGGAEYRKIAGVENPADLMTKHVGGGALLDHCHRLHLQDVAGRAMRSSKVSQGVEKVKKATERVAKYSIRAIE